LEIQPNKRSRKAYALAGMMVPNNEKRYRVALEKAISAGPRLNHTSHGQKITSAATQTVFKMLQPSDPNGPNP
jgi:hypothetical protein